MLARWPFLDSSDASHQHSPPEHIGSMNNYDTERFCVDATLSGSMSFQEAWRLVSEALYKNSPDEDWDGVNEGLVFFAPTGECVANPIGYNKVRILIQEYVSPSPCNFDTGCEQTRGPEYFDPESGHNEFPRSDIYIKTQRLIDEPNYIVNHEVGHALNFEDGEADVCPTSIMHSQGSCPSREFPTAEDRAALEAHIPDVAVGGGGSGATDKGFF